MPLGPAGCRDSPSAPGPHRVPGSRPAAPARGGAAVISDTDPVPSRCPARPGVRSRYRRSRSERLPPHTGAVSPGAARPVVSAEFPTVPEAQFPGCAERPGTSAVAVAGPDAPRIAPGVLDSPADPVVQGAPGPSGYRSRLVARVRVCGSLLSISSSQSPCSPSAGGCPPGRDRGSGRAGRNGEEHRRGVLPGGSRSHRDLREPIHGKDPGRFCRAVLPS